MAADAAKVLGVPPAGGDEGVLRRYAATPHPPPAGAPVSLRVGRFADLTRHRRVIQHREPLKGKAILRLRARTPHPALRATFPPGGRLEDQREMVWPWPFFRAASSRAAAVEMSCKAIPVESKMVISSPPVRPGAAPEMTPPMSQRVPSKMPFL